MALACMYAVVFTKQVQNRASALNIMQIKDESLITIGNNNNSNKVLLIIVYILIILYYSPILQQNW